MKTFVRFYWDCLRRAGIVTWLTVSIISTVSTYGGPLAVKYLKLVDQSKMDAILVFCPFVVGILCLIFVPFWESFRMHQQLLQKYTTLRSEVTAAKQSPAVAKITELIAVGLILRSEVVTSDATLTQWEQKYETWARTAFDIVNGEFGEAEAHILTHPTYQMAFIGNSWGDGHNTARLTLEAMIETLKELRGRPR